MISNKTLVLATIFVGAISNNAFSHGDVTPQAVDSADLPDIGEEWLTENPYRTLEDETKNSIIEIGSSAYNQNCARCHGLEAISGGIAPDLRQLEATAYDDEWYMQRIRNGYTSSNGAVMMPPFESVFDQKAMWAIRTYVESRPKD